MNHNRFISYDKVQLWGLYFWNTRFQIVGSTSALIDTGEVAIHMVISNLVNVLEIIVIHS